MNGDRGPGTGEREPGNGGRGPETGFFARPGLTPPYPGAIIHLDRIPEYELPNFQYADVVSQRSPNTESAEINKKRVPPVRRPSRTVPHVVVGLTGGIGSGKSTVASLFGERGARVVFADALVRQLLKRPAVRRALVRAFGPDVARGGRIDRAAVADRAFRNAASVRRLNAAVHPHVRREILRRIVSNARRPGITVLDAALLHEAGSDRLCGVLVFVDTPRRLRLKRLANRGWDEAELSRRERAQWDPARKRPKADYVVRNHGSRAALKSQVLTLLEKIREKHLGAPATRARGRMHGA